MDSDLLARFIIYMTAGVGFCILGVYIVLRAPRNDATLEMLVTYFGVVVALWGLLMVLLARNHLHEAANPERVQKF